MTRRLPPPPEVKTCADPDCGVGFTRAADQSDHSWRRTSYCHECGLKHSRGQNRGPVTRTAPHLPASFAAPEGLPRGWRDHAVCRDDDPELFFPVGTTGPARLQIAEAKAVCELCPVIGDCLEWALGSGSDAGVWGGLDEEERRLLKRRRSRARAKAVAS